MKKRWIIPIIALLAVCILAGFWFGLNQGFQQAENVRAEGAIFGDIIAVVNADTGVLVDGAMVNYSSAIIQTLGEGFHLVSPAMAQNGLAAGVYSAILTFPSNVSERIIAFNAGHTQRVELEFIVNPLLSETQYIETHVQLLDLQMAINLTLAHTYISSIFSQFHAGQDEVSVVFGNNENKVSALEFLELQAFTVSLMMDFLPDIPFEINDPDTTQHLLAITDFARDISAMYLESYREAREAFFSMRARLFGLVEDFEEQSYAWLFDIEKWTEDLRNYADALEFFANRLAEHFEELEDWAAAWHGDFDELHGDLSDWHGDLYDIHGDLEDWHNELDDLHTALSAWHNNLDLVFQLINHLFEEPQFECLCLLPCRDVDCRDCDCANCNYCSCNCAACDCICIDCIDGDCVNVNCPDCTYITCICVCDHDDCFNCIPTCINYPCVEGACSTGCIQNCADDCTDVFQSLWDDWYDYLMIFIEEIQEDDGWPLAKAALPPFNVDPRDFLPDNYVIPDVPDAPDDLDNLPEFLYDLPIDPTDGRDVPRPDDFWDYDLHAAILLFDIYAFLTDDIRAAIDVRLGQYADYLGTVRLDLESQFAINVAMLMDVRSGYVQYLADLRTAAMDAESAEMDNLRERIESFREIAERSSDDTQERLINFSGMIPLSRTYAGVNREMVDFVVAPIDLVRPALRAEMIADGTTMTGVIPWWLWLAFGIFGVSLIVVILCSIIEAMRRDGRLHHYAKK